MRRLIHLVFLLIVILSTACTPEQRNEVATLAAQAGQTAVAEGKKIGATQAAALQATASARLATEAVRAINHRWIIGLDPGHGWGGESGAAYGDMLEKDLNLAVAVKTRAILEEYGYQVVLTRESDELSFGLERAAQVVNEARANVVVSIHTNSGGGTGTEACYTYGKSTDAQSQQLATLLTENVSTNLGLENRGIFLENDPGRCGRGRPQLYIHDMNAPAALVELAFIDSDSDRSLLLNRQDDFAAAIASAIMIYLGK